MLFNSIEFMFFFPLVTAIYFLVPHRFRWGLLLTASCLFYMAFIPAYILILGATICVDYAAALMIEGSVGRRRKGYLVASILMTCMILFVFKYFNFFRSSAWSVADALNLDFSIPVLSLALPIGLSFHTFQSLSYVIEVYRGNQKAERHFGIYSLYVMFYPQLVAGPIERPQNLLHQFREHHVFEYQRVADGLKLMAWGMFKKVVIADRLAIAVNQVYGNPSGYEGLSLILATVFFAIQIYCDFSGYSDIAIGAAQVMGFKLMDNFNRPYYSKSVSEFWTRWHISLSTWFKDYVYIPLGGNRVSKWRWQLNLMLTFLISGLWHGANWTYVIWGALNGFYLVLEFWSINAKKRIADLVRISSHPRIHNALKALTTFALICFAWIFFRAESMTDAIYIASHLFSGMEQAFDKGYVMGCLMSLGLSRYELVIAVFSIVFMEIVHLIQRHGSIRTMLRGRPACLRWSIYYSVVLGIAVFGVFGRNDFIYFQF